MGRYLMTPAVTGSLWHGRVTWRDPMHIGVDLAWWTDKSIIRHNGLLISYFYGKEYYNWRKHFNVRDDVLVIADSGASNRPHRA